MDILILIGAGQIGMAIARRIGYGMKTIVGDKSIGHAVQVADTLNKAGFNAVPTEADLASRPSILALLDTALHYGEIRYLVNAAGVSPSQASIETILKVDLYGTAVVLEEVGKVIKCGGTGLTVSSQSGHRLPALGEEADRLLVSCQKLHCQYFTIFTGSPLWEITSTTDWISSSPKDGSSSMEYTLSTSPYLATPSLW